MKKFLLPVTLVASTLFIVSCKKNIQPVITLNGDQEMAVPLNGTYTELGATAKDNKDGDLTDDVVITGTVNEDQVGEYRIFYNVEDKEGNKAATQTRFVNVFNEADYMVGGFIATPSCGGSGTSDIYNTAVTVSYSTNNRIWINNLTIEPYFYSAISGPVYADVSGTTITIPNQFSGSESISGTGTITGDDFSVDVLIGGVITCSISHVKL